MVDMALQSALSLNINACLIHWAATDTPETWDSDSLLSACSRFVPGMRCDPLSCLIPAARGVCEATDEMLVCGEAGRGEMSLLSSRIKCCLEYTGGGRQAGPTLFYKMEIAHGFYYLLKIIHRIDWNKCTEIFIFVSVAGEKFYSQGPWWKWSGLCCPERNNSIIQTTCE